VKRPLFKTPPLGDTAQAAGRTLHSYHLGSLAAGRIMSDPDQAEGVECLGPGGCSTFTFRAFSSNSPPLSRRARGG
jgi:hypothetical protein